MTRHDLATAAIRLLAVFALTMLDGTVTSLLRYPPIGGMYLHVLFQIGFAALLWLLAPVMARFLVPACAHPDMRVPDLSLLLSVGYGGVALALAVQAIALFAETYAMYGAVTPRTMPEVPDARTAFAIAVVQFVAAAVLFLGRRGVRSLIGAVRS